jgi:hypothetical protein
MAEIRPHEGPQEVWLSSCADIAIYGGAAGGGKTFALLMEALRHTGAPGFGAVIFRRKQTDIRKEGAIWDNSQDLYSQIPGATPRELQLDWTFSSGATITFNGLQYETDIYDWQGAQICLLAFDELTHFSKKQFLYLLSRNRSTCGVRPYIRGTLNPDPDSWVFELLAPWVNPEHPRFGAQSGEIRWFIVTDGEIVWVPEGTQFAKSITFVSATVFDNKTLMERDPGYLANLHALPPDEKARLLYGLWTALEAKGALWKREWITRDRVAPGAPLPRLVRTVVAVDPAVSSDPGADETGIVVVAKGDDAHFYTLEDASGHYTPEGWAKVTLVHAKVGKQLRAEPVAAAAEAGRDHHVGTFPALEGQMTRWVPGSNDSPDRLDAKVYAILDLDPTLVAPLDLTPFRIRLR